MTRRPGLTLMEVLVTIVIAGLGILALLTLLPLAASQMAIAVREDRSAQAAAQADGYFRAYWKNEIVEKNGGAEPFYYALSNPGGGLPALLPTDNGPSYPVLVDPMGYFARSGQVNQGWLGDPNAGPPATRSTNVPRQNLNLITSSFYSMRACGLPDSLSYDDDGRPKRSTTPVAPGPPWFGEADREWRYNWAWIIQRPVNTSLYSAAMTVIVFDNRAPLYAPTGAEAVFSASFTPNSPTTVGSTTVFVANGPPTATSPTGAPEVKPGGWIMDATVTVPGPGVRTLRHANLYQVVSITPGAGNTTVLELQTVVKAASDMGTNPYTGTLVVLRGVSGVYTRPQLASGN